MGIKPGDSGVVLGYQVGESTHTWSAVWFVAHSHTYPGFTGKVWSLTYFPLEPGCEDYAFLDQAVTNFRVSTPAMHYFSTYITTTDWYQDSVQHAVLGLSE